MLLTHKQALLAPKHPAKNYIKHNPHHVGQQVNKEPLLPFAVSVVPVWLGKEKKILLSVQYKNKVANFKSVWRSPLKSNTFYYHFSSYFKRKQKDQKTDRTASVRGCPHFTRYQQPWCCCGMLVAIIPHARAGSAGGGMSMLSVSLIVHNVFLMCTTTNLSSSLIWSNAWVIWHSWYRQHYAVRRFWG